MNRTLLLVAASLCANAMAAPSAPIKPPVGHSIIGKWQWVRGANNCTETYLYRTDGSSPVISGTERSDNLYTVDADPDPNGFYRLVVKTTKDYGGKDCGDDEGNNTGQENTFYIVFDGPRNQYMTCFAASLDKCFGPMRRIDDSMPGVRPEERRNAHNPG